MIKHLIITLIFIGSMQDIASASVKRKCSLNTSMKPKCYHKRSQPILKVALVYYGDYYQLEDLDRIETILVKRFAKATADKVRVEIIDKKIIPFKQTMPVGYSFNNITDPKRLQRIFYGQTVSNKVIQEVYEEYKKRNSKQLMDKLDALLAITGAQFEGLGFATGRVSVTEQPREIAWGLPDGGRVEHVSDYQIVDELIHELGHNMFLGHTSTQCNIRYSSDPDELAAELERSRQCCQESPARNDVLSYCRKRNAVNEIFMHGFEACNQSMIENLIVPAMLKGDRWNIAGRKRCP